MTSPFLAQLHHHVVSDLDRSARADTVFVFGAVVLDVVSLAVTSALARSQTTVASWVLLLLLAGVFIVSTITIAALANGSRECRAYRDALLAMYAKEGVSDFVPRDTSLTGMARYRLSCVLVLVLGLLAILVPVIVKAQA